MGDINWVHVITSLLGGGAMGAVINAFVAAYRGRLQRIGSRISFLPVFRQDGGASSLSAKIAVTHEQETRTFDNLFLAELQVVNRSNKDISEFDFGATLVGEGDQCIYVETSPPDRHHKVLQSSLVTPQAPSRELDFKLTPFNRGDSYSFKLYIVIPESRVEPGKIILGSSSPIKFIEIPTVGELLASATEMVLLNVGPLRIGMWR